MILIATFGPFAAGCWTVPNAEVQPAGTPGLIQDEIVVDYLPDRGVVSGKDNNQQRIILVSGISVC